MDSSWRFSGWYRWIIAPFRHPCNRTAVRCASAEITGKKSGYSTGSPHTKTRLSVFAVTVEVPRTASVHWISVRVRDVISGARVVPEHTDFLTTPDKLGEVGEVHVTMSLAVVELAIGVPADATHSDSHERRRKGSRDYGDLGESIPMSRSSKDV